MAMSTFQKMTLATCLVLCVALLLPRMLLSRGGRKDAADRPEGAGRLPPMMPRQAASEGRGQRSSGSGFSRAQTSTDSTVRAKGAGTGAGTGGKSNLAGQIIPVYGFGILFYILYILFKITNKGSSKPAESRFPSVRSENTKRKITDFELAQLQERLRETELVMEKIVSNAHHSPDRVKGVTVDQEVSLLQQLSEITRVMQEGQMVDNMAADADAEKKTPGDWEAPADYPEEPQQFWEHSHCHCPHHGPHSDTHTEAHTEAHTDTHTEAHFDTHTETHTEAHTETQDQKTPVNKPETVQSGGEAEETETRNKDDASESDLTAVSGVEVNPHSDLGFLDEEEDSREHQEGGGGPGMDPGAPEEELEVEVEVKVTCVTEQDKTEDHSKPTEVETTRGSVRRRNKKRRAKKSSH